MSNQQRNTIYVSGLSSTINEDSLFNAFQPFGEIVEIHIPKQNQHQNQTTGNNDDKEATTTQGPNRGFGFVVFSSPEDVEGAIDNMHLNEIEGRVITCTIAKPMKGGGGSLSSNNNSSRKAIWEDEEWIKQYGTGQDVTEGTTE